MHVTVHAHPAYTPLHNLVGIPISVTVLPDNVIRYKLCNGALTVYFIRSRHTTTIIVCSFCARTLSGAYYVIICVVHLSKEKLI